MKNFSKFLLVLLVLSFFSCSTDDDPLKEREEQEEFTKVLTGAFAEPIVSGLTFATETQEGVTNVNGEFSYLEEERVTFWVGSLELGSAFGAADLGLASILAADNAVADPEAVKNMAALLMSLDADHDLSNGISIDAEVADAITTSDIDFSQPIIKTLGEILAEVYKTTGIHLKPVYPEEAATKMADSRGETYEPDDLVFGSFIPFIESFDNNVPNSFQWIHEIDETGKLVTSEKYEKIPYNLDVRFTYLEYNDKGLPTKVKREESALDDQTFTSIWEIEYSAEGEVGRLTWYNEDGSVNYKAVVVGFDQQSRVQEVNYYYSDGIFMLRRKFIYDDEGNPYLIMTSRNESGGDETFNGTIEMTFNENGDLLKSITTQGEMVNIFENFYRSNGTLERSESSDYGTSIMTFDEREIRVTAVVMNGDYRTDWFYENGKALKAETYFQDFLYEIVTYNEDGSTEWKTINQEDLSYRIEYKNTDGNIYKTEYYDAEGNLLSTE